MAVSLFDLLFLFCSCCWTRGASRYFVCLQKIVSLRRQTDMSEYISHEYAATYLGLKRTKCNNGATEPTIKNTYRLTVNLNIGVFTCVPEMSKKYIFVMALFDKTKMPHNMQSHSVSVCVGIFTGKRHESAQAAIKPRSVECCSDVCLYKHKYVSPTYDHGAQLEWPLCSWSPV